MRISYLADHPEFIPPLARGRFEHFREFLPEMTMDDHIQRLQTHLHRDELPIAWVAHSGNEPYGMAALRVHDLDGREDLTPWLAAVYVLPQFRRRGVGEALCRAVEQKASEMGVRTLYLFTLDKQKWYAQFGWNQLESCTWQDQPAAIMAKSLGQR